MATKNIKSEATIIDLATKKAITLSNRANNFALKTTEKAFITSFGIAEKCLVLSNKAVKKGLQISAAQQNMVFNVLDSAKGKLVKTVKKSK